MVGLDHPFIARLHTIAFVPTHVAFVMEYVPCQDFQGNGRLRSTTLEKYLGRYTATGLRMPEPVVKHHAFQLLSAVQYVHSMNIAHRDLKVRSRRRRARGAATLRCGVSRACGAAQLDNVLVDDTDCLLTAAGVPSDDTLARCVVKVCDWGLSKHQAHLGPAATPGLGNATFWAPELVNVPVAVQTPWDARQSDVWSCGIMLFKLLRGKYPHGPDASLTPQQAVERKASNTFAPPLGQLSAMNVPASTACIELLGRMLDLIPGTRATVTDALAHRWFADVVLN